MGLILRNRRVASLLKAYIHAIVYGRWRRADLYGRLLARARPCLSVGDLMHATQEGWETLPVSSVADIFNRRSRWAS